MTTAAIVRYAHPASLEVDAEGQRRQPRVLDELVIAGRSGDTTPAHQLGARRQGSVEGRFMLDRHVGGLLAILWEVIDTRSAAL